ncbi:hypothetical protein [Streptomyces finlayi]|uniref:hypothetical protein n=1 Tax=Streptomyces finlayi TaxID=67296 RepID=UPI0035BC587C
MAGLAAVLVTMPVLFGTVQLLGGAYVLHLGLSERRPPTTRAIEGGSGVALTALGLVPVGGPLLH